MMQRIFLAALMLMSFAVPAPIGAMLARGSVPAGPAHEHHHADGPSGAVHFPVSCQREVQEDFDRAVAILHSFGYEAARRGFLRIAEEDPSCGMAWWGVAMTYFHQHWDQPTPSELTAGREAAEKAAGVGAESDRERGYIAAIGAFYRDSDRLDHKTRVTAYAAAMESLATDFPEDPEASIFHALALLASRPPDDPSHANQKRAAAILERLLPEHAAHPGIIHYTIHAFDYPGLAELALPAARIYARVAPDEPHALHMPSHIFTRLGLWQESIASNLDVVRAARQQMARSNPGATYYEELHAQDYLVYAYLQLGQDQKAAAVVEEVAKVRHFNVPTFSAGHALVAIPARYALERRDWRAAASLEPPAADLPWESFPFARGGIDYARAIGAARLGDVEKARAAVGELARLQTALAAAPARGPYDWAARIEAMRLAAAGWLAHAEGKDAEAVRLLTEAAELEERVGKHPVTPGPILPAREMLGDLLLTLDRPQEARVAYEATLAESPGRFNTLAGAARAAELAGDEEAAGRHYEELLERCQPPDCRRPAARR